MSTDRTPDPQSPVGAGHGVPAVPDNPIRELLAAGQLPRSTTPEDLSRWASVGDENASRRYRELREQDARLEERAMQQKAEIDRNERDQAARLHRYRAVTGMMVGAASTVLFAVGVVVKELLDLPAVPLTATTGATVLASAGGATVGWLWLRRRRRKPPAGGAPTA
jgi:hypothetical protein